jgi:hypothetical protein
MAKGAVIPVERIETKILLARGQKVLLDVKLAELYGVETRVLVQAVKRNIERFPKDFMFQSWKRALRRSSLPTTRPSSAFSMRSES